MMTRALLFGICGVFAVVTTSLAQTQTSAPTTPPADTGLAQATTPARAPVSAVLADARETAFSTIQGNALNATNAPMADSLVRLRDARIGRIVNTQLTDKGGEFEFHAVDPGSYVVELLDGAKGANTVLAASELININAGEAASVVVQLPLQLLPVAGAAGFLSHTASQAAIVTAAAAATGVMKAVATTDVSPDGTNRQ